MKPIRIIVPDSGPLITLSVAGALDTLLAPKLSVYIPDMVRFEVIRDTDKPGAREIAEWIRANEKGLVSVKSTETFEEYQKLLMLDPGTKSKNRGETAAAELLTEILEDSIAILLFEDSAVAKQNFLLRLPENVLILSTSAYLDGLEKKGMIASASEILHRAVVARGTDIQNRQSRMSDGSNIPHWESEFDFGPK